MSQLIDLYPLSLSGRGQMTGLAENSGYFQQDSEMLALFLNRSASRSAETRRRYEREMIRFSVWLYREQGLNYHQVRLKQLQMYIQHIQDLPPHWLAAGMLSHQPGRVLFRHSVKPGKSTDQVIDVLASFFSFLEKNGFIVGNPAVSMVRSGEKLARGSSVIRFFYRDEWTFLLGCLDKLSKSPSFVAEYRRTHLVLTLAYSLALRGSELTGQSCNDIHPDGSGGFLLSVLGKGRKRRNLPLNSQLLATLRDYLAGQGYHQLSGHAYPLAPRIRSCGGKPASLSSRGLRFWWKEFMDYCTRHTNDEAVADRFSSMPFHAVRHTALTHLANTMDIEDLALFAGHDSIQTTSQYYHVEADRLKKLTATHVLSSLQGSETG